MNEHHSNGRPRRFRFFLPHRQTWEPVIMLRSMLVMLACLVSLSTGFVAPTASLVARPALQESQVQRCVRSGLSHALLSRVRVACAHRSRWGAEISAPPRVSGGLTPTATPGRLTATCGILRPRRRRRLLRRSDGTICSVVWRCAPLHAYPSRAPPKALVYAR